MVHTYLNCDQNYFDDLNAKFVRKLFSSLPLLDGAHEEEVEFDAQTNGRIFQRGDWAEITNKAMVLTRVRNTQNCRLNLEPRTLCFYDKKDIACPVFVLHSHLPDAARCFPTGAHGKLSFGYTTTSSVARFVFSNKAGCIRGTFIKVYRWDAACRANKICASWASLKSKEHQP